MDPTLIESAQQGDQQAFERLAVEVYPRLFRVAQGMLRDTHAAEDAVQQALIAMWRYLPRLRDPARFEGWSYRLLVHACYDEAERQPKWLPEAAMGAVVEPHAADDYLGVVQREQLERAFPRLSVEHRAVIVLRYRLDLPLQQVADALDVSVGTVGSRLNRALKALRAALEADARPTAALGEQGATAR